MSIRNYRVKKVKVAGVLRSQRLCLRVFCAEDAVDKVAAPPAFACR